MERATYGSYKSYGYAEDYDVRQQALCPDVEDSDEIGSFYCNREVCSGLTAKDINQPKGKVYRG